MVVIALKLIEFVKICDELVFNVAYEYCVERLGSHTCVTTLSWYTAYRRTFRLAH